MKTKLLISAAVLLTFSSCSRVVEEATASFIESMSSIKKDTFKKLDQEISLEIDYSKLAEGVMVTSGDLKRCAKIISERLDATSEYRFKMEHNGENFTVKVSNDFDKSVLIRAVSTDVLNFHRLKSVNNTEEYFALLTTLDSICEIHYSSEENYDSTDLLDSELSELLGPVSTVPFTNTYFSKEDIEGINEKIALPVVQKYLKDSKLLWSTVQVDSRTGKEMFQLYHLFNKPAMTGSTIEKASSSISNYSSYVINVEFSNRGAKEFSRVTARCMGKQLAIVYGDVVLSAPMVNERINGGKAQISGAFTEREARELAAMISTGELPLPMKIKE